MTVALHYQRCTCHAGRRTNSRSITDMLQLPICFIMRMHASAFSHFIFFCLFFFDLIFILLFATYVFVLILLLFNRCWRTCFDLALRKVPFPVSSDVFYNVGGAFSLVVVVYLAIVSFLFVCRCFHMHRFLSTLCVSIFLLSRLFASSTSHQQRSANDECVCLSVCLFVSRIRSSARSGSERIGGPGRVALRGR